MATTETVKIVFDVDSKELTDTTKQLVDLGKVVDDDAAKFKKLNTEASNSDKAFTSLRTQVKQAKDEVARLSEEFGEFSAEANAARQKAGQLADQMSDLNRQVNLLNPEAKARAFVNFGQGVVGAFQVATGALQAFGAENEEVQKIAQKLQGALNVVQGIASIKALKESYQDIKVVLGVTTAAQNVLTTANTAGGVAATGAATATRGFTAALLANPFTAIAVAIGAVAGAFFLLKDNTEDSTEAVKENAKALEDARKTWEDFQKSTDDRIASYKNEIGVLKGEYTPLQAKINQLERERRQELEKVFDIVSKTKINEKYDLAITVEKLKADKGKIKQEVKAINDEIEKIGLKGISDVDVLKLSDEDFNQLEFYLKAWTTDAFELRKAMQEVNKELDAIGPISVKSKNSTEQLNQELFDREDKLLEKQRQRVDQGFQIASQLTDIFLEEQNRRNEAEIASLEEARERGIITEEQYEAKVKQIKRKGAEDAKKTQIFQATMSAAQAILTALATLYPDPASKTAAVVFAATVGALNLAKIIATPIPKFKEGTLNFQGGNIDGDGGALAVLHPNEAVIPADRNRAYHPTLEAIYKKQIKPSELNAFVLNKLAGKGGIGRDTQITASVDTYALGRAISKNKTVHLGNAEAVGNVIAKKLLGAYNIRRS